MQLARKLIYLALVAFFLAPRPVRADDLKQVLQRLDTAARSFHTTSATVEFDSVTTDPIPDTDIMKGVTYYERTGTHFQWAAHINDHNNRRTDRIYILSGGVLKESDSGKASDARDYPQASKYESYLRLGFGASGKDLADQWDISYGGSEIIDGIKTDKLQLVAKDPTVRKNIPSVTIWMDTDRAVSVKQIFDEGGGQTRTCLYTNIKVNQSLPADAFSFSK